MSKRNGKQQTVEALIQSDPDTIALGDAVGERINTVFETYRQKRGMELLVPDSLQPDMLLFIEMNTRHGRGDFRHYPKEARATKTIAQWTVDVYRVLRGQKSENIEWKE